MNGSSLFPTPCPGSYSKKYANENRYPLVKELKVSSSGNGKDRQMKTILISLVVVILLIPTSSNAQSASALLEKCGEKGEKFFFERIKLYGGSWGSFSDEKGHGYNHFTTYYNKKFDKCFVRIEYSYFPKDKDEKSIKAIEIYDAFEGKRLAGCSFSILSPIECKVGNKTCNSLSEFETLIKPYMTSNGEVWGAGWTYFGIGNDSTFWWYDSGGMTYHPNKVIRVWIKVIKAEEIFEMFKGGATFSLAELEKMTSEKEYVRCFMEIDCLGNTVDYIQRLHYDSKGILKAGEVDSSGRISVPAKSVAERLYQAVCK